MQLTRLYGSQVDPAVQIRVKRISLRERLRFSEESFDLMQRLKVLTAQSELSSEDVAKSHALETQLTELILRYVWVALETPDSFHEASQSEIEWLLNVAPAELCCEVVALCGDQIALSGAQRKK